MVDLIVISASGFGVKEKDEGNIWHLHREIRGKYQGLWPYAEIIYRPWDAPWHHLDGDKANCEKWNLAALCQKCHLTVQAKVRMRQRFLFAELHSDWMKPFLYGRWAATGEKP